MHWLAFIWGGIIGFCIIMYIILDGFTLGTALILPILDRGQCDIAVSVILPTWDGNQTWLVLGLAALYGAFPIAFSLLLPVLYLPLLLLAIFLLFRGIAFEFRLKSYKPYWDHVFTAASLCIAAVQGLILGNFVQGFHFDRVNDVLQLKGFFTPFTLFTAVSLIIGYLLLGSTRLILKTTGKIQAKMNLVAKRCLPLLGLCIFIVCLWTPFVDNFVLKRWLTIESWPYLVFLPTFTVIAFITALLALERGYDRAPYWGSVGMFLCLYFGFAASVYPYIVPYHIPYWQAASPDGTLKFILVGAVIMLPVLLFYTGYSYKIFSGKVEEKLHY